MNKQSKLYGLSPKIGDDGLIRVTGRIESNAKRGFVGKKSSNFGCKGSVLCSTGFSVSQKGKLLTRGQSAFTFTGIDYFGPNDG